MGDPVERSRTEIDRIESELIGAGRAADQDQWPRMQNLLWIEKNPVYKSALAEWDRQDKLYMERVDRLEKRSGNLKNEVYQLVGFFTVFLGVVLTAVTQMVGTDLRLTCKKVWGPALLIGLAWFVTSFGVYFKLRTIHDFDVDRVKEDRYRRAFADMTTSLRSGGADFRFGLIQNGISPPKLPWHYFWTHRYLPVVATLAVFTGICIACFFSILCNRGLAPIRV